ncbi:MAG: hypothetical protein ACD_62C00658G0004 [uncultured bacterium]|nr:MAG: hypothetical protein ACD_62C00658G0004 [uncultured bacterium]HLD46056.1 CGGC domain-containing protein [bacterium]
MSKIAMISCGNVKNELNCSSFGCHQNFNARTGGFAPYQNEQVYELVGTLSCTGCPTLVAPEKILNKVKPLVAMGNVDAIHFASCMLAVCPFVNKYKSVIEENCPGVKVVLGTEDTGSPEETRNLLEVFKGVVKKLLTQNKPDLMGEFKKMM